MISDFVPIVHTLGGRTVRVWAVADVHLGSRECDVDGFSAFVAKAAKDPDAYIVLCGDMVNNGVKDSLTNVYEEVMMPSAQIEKAVELLEPVKDRILGAVGGNHESRSRKAVDLDPMYAIMLMLGKGELYRTNFAMLRINLERGNTKDHYALMLVHGKTENKKRQFAYAVEGVDAIVSGHTHNGIVEKPARLCFTQQNNIVVKPLVSLTATSWLGYGGYGAAGLYKPAATSDPQCLELEFTGSNDRKGRICVRW